MHSSKFYSSQSLQWTQLINTNGICILKVRVKGKEHYLMFVIVPDGQDSLLGLVKRVYRRKANAQNSVESIVDQYPDIFKGFGIQLKEDTEPVIHAPVQVPAPLQDKLKLKVDQMTS
ncbi:hypothetical protein N1851_024932 [Merluccius polli]|uniref:Uncharacterized protein n=1 Tax=Merluccius polli TaxID=89951 RepID=A0AA47ME22_MERPO|nr:hypothetical protein N1851_024932 [Merluccius polli]